ncbi:hypothetical protein GGI07_005816 [Coemansia sp. Benny D115]|nr:hypothetical protein GGI07_005816 [Coemansia sp. Benny D115]
MSSVRTAPRRRTAVARDDRRPALLVLGILLLLVCYGLALREPKADSFSTASVARRKSSVINKYFAKVGWGWTSLCYALASALLPSRLAVGRRLSRYMLATLYWVFVSQWFFGPALLDRLYVHTGGKCTVDSVLDNAGGTVYMPQSATLCRKVGGMWIGGHDASGHCFLLLHSALFLVEEVLAPLFHRIRSSSRGSGSRDIRRAEGCFSAEVVAVALTGALVCLWGATLYSTARYFHGPAEVASGVAFGMAYWVPVYVLRVAAQWY